MAAGLQVGRGSDYANRGVNTAIGFGISRLEVRVTAASNRRGSSTCQDDCPVPVRSVGDLSLLIHSASTSRQASFYAGGGFGWITSGALRPAVALSLGHERTVGAFGLIRIEARLAQAFQGYRTSSWFGGSYVTSPAQQVAVSVSAGLIGRVR